MVRVDDGLMTAVQALGPERLSSVVTTVLAYEMERRSRAAALGRMLANGTRRTPPSARPTG